MHVLVRIKDENHAKKVIKRLVRVGYEEFTPSSPIPISSVKKIVVYGDGDYQLSQFVNGDMIKPKDVMNSAPVKYFLEHNYV